MFGGVFTVLEFGLFFIYGEIGLLPAWCRVNNGMMVMLYSQQGQIRNNCITNGA